jgi:hypothetical protein
MARLVTPLLYRTLRVTGDVLVRAEIRLLLCAHHHIWRLATFRIDSGTEMTTMLAFDARQLDLPMPQQPVPGFQFAGQEVRAGLLRLQVLGMAGTAYVIPCYFLGDPAKSPSAPSPNLLGLSGFIDKIQIHFDGRAGAGAPYGRVVLET